MPLQQFDRKELASWVKNFSEREALYVFVCTSLGAVAAGLLHLLVIDHSVHQILATKYLPSRSSFDDPSTYVSYVLFAAIAAGFAALLISIRLLRIGLRSWLLGVTSGLNLFSFCSTVLLLSLPAIRLRSRAELDVSAVAIFFVCSLALYCWGQYRNNRLPTEEELDVVDRVPSDGSLQVYSADDPIRSWNEDALGRSSIVRSLSIKLLISRVPVIALFGDFGSGKTSILNLLRLHLDGKAIVVSFSTWLPGSQETLTSYLMGDIAAECQKHYVVPGLKKGTTRLAAALSETVPYLKGYSKLFPAATQKDDIETLRKALSRLPKRVVVLLDELDRMERNELLPLLKVIRGIAGLPNLSFVCAAERTVLTKTVCLDANDESNLYFEKFFPSSQAVPRLDPELLMGAGVDRVTSVLQKQLWFKSADETSAFRKTLTAEWPARIAPFCRNLRAIGLLANDVGIAAAPLRREVDPIDLTLVEVLRRFKPAVYDLVARNPVVLTGGSSWLRGGSYQSDDDVKELQQAFAKALATAAGAEDQLKPVKDLLGNLFPRFANDEKMAWDLRSEQEGTKHIYDAGMFPAYFRYSVSTAMYSAVAFENLMAQTVRAATDAEREQVFIDELRSMEKQSLRRDDFLRKAAEAVKAIDVVVSSAWTRGAVRAAADLSYDTMTAFGEAGHVIRMIIRSSSRIKKKSERISYLADLIQIATDDTMAFRVLTQLTRTDRDFMLDVSVAELYAAFITRMRHLYGLDVDAQNVELATSDYGSFHFWGAADLSKHDITPDPLDRQLQRDFWKRYIGTDRRRLIVSFYSFFFPHSLYSAEDIEPWIEATLDIPTIRELYENLPPLEDMSTLEKKAERKLHRFLKGDFKDGVDFHNIGEEDPSEEQDV